MQAETAKPISSAVDYIGKIVGCFGLISGLAYLCGWAQLYFFLSKFNAEWALDFGSPQYLIQRGMPWVLICALVCALLLGSVRSLPDARGVAGIITILPAPLIYVLILFFPNLGEFFAKWIFPYIFMAYGVLLLAVGLHAANTKQPPLEVAIMLLIALGWIVLIIPALRANQEAGNIRSKGVELAAARSSEFHGMILTVIGDKLLLQDCDSPKQLLIEPDASWAISPKVLWCQ